MELNDELKQKVIRLYTEKKMSMGTIGYVVGLGYKKVSRILNDADVVRNKGYWYRGK